MLLNGNWRYLSLIHVSEISEYPGIHNTPVSKFLKNVVYFSKSRHGNLNIDEKEKQLWISNLQKR